MAVSRFVTNTGLTQGSKAAVAMRLSPAQLTDSSLPEIVDSNSKDKPEGITFNESKREQGMLSYILSFCLCKYPLVTTPYTEHKVPRLTSYVYLCYALPIV